MDLIYILIKFQIKKNSMNSLSFNSKKNVDDYHIILVCAFAQY